MRTYVKKTMVFVVVIGLVGPPLAVAGSIKTFHRSWTHSGGYSQSSGGRYTVATYSPCRAAVVRSTPSTPVATAPEKSEVASKPAKTGVEVPVAASERSAKRTTGTRSFSYESDNASSAPLVRRNYSSPARSSGREWSYDQAMRAKGYYIR